MENTDALRLNISDINLSFDDEFYKRCDIYISSLQQWGAIHNFTSSKALKVDEIIKNIVDSIYPLKFLNNFNSLADVGTGAGYPGMILAIAKPETKITLIEPRLKRVAFLNYLKSALKLDNIQILSKRVEDIDNESFDIITSRAVSNTSLLLKLTKNITRENTEFLFYKGSLCKEEIQEIKINNYDIINNGKHRNFLYIKKGQL